MLNPRVILVVLFSLSTSSYGEVDQKLLDELDDASVRVVAFGDPVHKYPENLEEIKKICDRYRNLAKSEKVHNLFIEEFLSNRDFRKVAAKTILELAKSKMCDVDAQNPEFVIKALKEINSKCEVLAPIRERIVNVFVDAAKPGTKINVTTLACYVKKWAQEMTDKFEGPTKQLLGIVFGSYTHVADEFKPPSNCAWDDIPKATGKHLKSVDLLFLMAAKHVVSCRPKN